MHREHGTSRRKAPPRDLGEYLGEYRRYAVVHTNDQWQEDLRKKKLTLREKFEVTSTYFLIRSSR